MKRALLHVDGAVRRFVCRMIGHDPYFQPFAGRIWCYRCGAATRLVRVGSCRRLS